MRKVISIVKMLKNIEIITKIEMWQVEIIYIFNISNIIINSI